MRIKSNKHKKNVPSKTDFQLGMDILKIRISEAKLNKDIKKMMALQNELDNLTNRFNLKFKNKSRNGAW